MGVPSVYDTLGNESLEATTASVTAFSSDNKIGGFYVSKGWFFKEKLLGGYYGFRAVDIAWVYPTRVQTKLYGVVTTNTSWKVTMRIRPDKEVEMLRESGDNSLITASSDHALRALQNMVPWAIFGFSAYRKECWKEDRPTFLKLVDERLEAIRTAISTGRLTAGADGTLVQRGEVKIPILLHTFTKNDKGKVTGRKYHSSSSVNADPKVTYYRA